MAPTSCVPRLPRSALPSMLQAGFRFALSLTHHRHDAADLTQQSWLNLARRHGRVRNKSLLFSTIRNLFYDQYRRERC